jgi:diketogulonate reductase-like aldo/keto reductase
MNIPSLKMNTGAMMPQIGFGLWQNGNNDECVNSVLYALEAGYRHFDDAQVYDNEEYLGEAIKKSGWDRKELFITTKIASNMKYKNNQPEDKLVPSFEESLKKLQMGYVDLLLLHFPATDTRQPAWKIMEELYESGRSKAIGVSNYTVRHLEELLKDCKVKPAVNQVELSVVLQQPELVDYCKKNHIIVQAYTPLAEGHFFDDPTLAEVAKKHGKTVPQIMLRWCIEYGVVALTKSTHEDRIKQNIDIFDFKLDADDMAKLKRLDKDYRTNWDPTDVA